MGKMNKKDIVKEIHAMIKKEQAFIDELKNNKNPQVVELVNQAKGKVDGMKDVLYFANRIKR